MRWIKNESADPSPEAQNQTKKKSQVAFMIQLNIKEQKST